MTEKKIPELYDVIIIGGGPAGLTAAIYLARARYRVLVMEKEQFGGQITITSEVVNYPGIPRTDGKTLTEAMRKQAAGFGAEFLKATAEKIWEERMDKISPEGEVPVTKEISEKMTEDHRMKQGKQDNFIWVIRTDRGEYRCLGLLAATGAHPRVIGFEGEEKFRGHGIAYCATCDGEFFTGKEIFVVGGGFAAAEESVFLTKYARHVTILVREPDFTCAKATADAARQHDKITVLVDTEVEAVTGNAVVTGIRYRNNRTGERTGYTAPEGDSIGVFVFAGYEPATELFAGTLELDEQGYIVTDQNRQTSVEGIYAAGDVCVKNLRQVVTAVGDGAAAATELEKYAAKMQKRIGIVPKSESAADCIFAGNEAKAAPGRESASAGNETKTAPAGESASDSASAGNEAKTAPGSGSISDSASAGEKSKTAPGSDSLFDEDTLAQLADVFDRMEQDLILEIHLDDRPISRELEEYMNVLSAMTERLSVRKADSRKAAWNTGRIADHEEQKKDVKKREGGDRADEEATQAVAEETLPCVKILRADGAYTGLAFHGVPGGHEFTPFILSLFNAAGPGQKIDSALERRIAAISRPAHMKIMVSLTCEVCPDLVTAAQRIAAGNPLVSAEVYDFAHFPQMSEKYHVLSVPCLIMNEDYATFGKKTMKQLLDILETVA